MMGAIATYPPTHNQTSISPGSSFVVIPRNAEVSINHLAASLATEDLDTFFTVSADLPAIFAAIDQEGTIRATAEDIG